MEGIHSALIGRAGGEAELKYTGGGKAVLNVNVAVQDRYIQRRGEQAQWVRLTLFGDQAEELEPRIGKGCEVYAEGRLRLNRWDGSDGQERSGLELVCWKLEPLGQVGKRRQAAQPDSVSAAGDSVETPV